MLKKLLEVTKVESYKKALVPIGVWAVLFGLSYVGVTAEMSVEDALYAILVSLGVYQVSNKK